MKPIYIILSPARTFGILLVSLRMIWFFGNYSYYGLVKGKTVTLVGLRKGLIARFYGFFYFLICTSFLLVFPFLFRDLFSYSWTDFIESFLYSFHFLYRGFLFIGISFFGVLLREYKFHKSNKAHFKSDVLQKRHKSNWIFFLFSSIAIRDLFGFPYLIEFTSTTIFFYFSPFLSPKKIK